MVNFRDFPLAVHCLGWFHIMTPVCDDKTLAYRELQEEARRSNLRHRPVGLGVQGFRGVWWHE